MTDEGTTRRVLTTATSLRILGVLRSDGATSLRELSDILDKSTSTVHEHLVTLHDHEFIVKENDRYRLSLKFLDYGMYVRDDYDIVDIAQPHLDDLAEETGDMIWLNVEEHGKVVRVADAAGEHGHATGSWLGERHHMHYFAAGKVFLANYPESSVNDILDAYGLEGQTPHTVQDRDRLFEELAEIREEGFAYADQEFTKGVRAVAAPIFYNDQVIAAIGISGPVTRFTEEYWREDLPGLLESTTNELELNLLTHRRDWDSPADS